MEKQPDQTPNFHEVAARRRKVREALTDGLPHSIERVHRGELEDLNEQAQGFTSAVEEAGGGLTKAKEILRGQKKESWQNKETYGRGIDEQAIRAELGEEYDALTSLSNDLAELSDFEIRRLREMKGNPYEKRVQENLLKQIKKEKSALREKLKEEKAREPNTVRAFELVQLREGLFEEGHIAHTPSVERYLSAIGTRMIHGKPMFIHGPTGTGKTSLARYAAKHFTGKNAEMVYCTPQTRESQIWGKTGIRPSGSGGAIETVEIFGPLARSMREGGVVVFDEFTALPREQMVFLKGVANAKPGDRISVPGNGEITIASGHQMIFTANLKSEKNPERQDLPPEIAREFEQNNLEVGYTPKDEAYKIMLARLMRPDGSLKLSWHDMNVTLPKLCEAMEEIQVAYADSARNDTAQLVGALDASGRKPALKKYVITQGTVEAMFESWETEQQLHNDISFAEYLDSRLATGLTFKEYPESDRLLAAKIFALKGLLRTITPAELGLPENVFNFDAARRSRGEEVEKLKEQSKKEVMIPLRELADLDPFGARGKRMADEANGFSGGEEPPEDAGASADAESLKRANEPFMYDVYKGWYSKETADKAKQEAVIIAPTMQDYGTLAGDTNAAEFGKYTLNPEAQGLDHERCKAFVPDLSQWNGRKLHEVMKHVVDTYGATYHIPGIEYWKWIAENPTKIPQNLKDGKYYFFPGSVLRVEDGHWRVPYGRWDGSRWRRYASWLTREWFAGPRVVLLEK